MSEDRPVSALAARQAKLFEAEEQKLVDRLAEATGEAKRHVQVEAQEAARRLKAEAADAARQVRTEAESASARAQETLGGLKEAQAALARLHAAKTTLVATEGRFQRLGRGVWLGVGAAALLLTVAVLVGLWIGARQIEAGRAEARRLVAEAQGAAEAVRAAGAAELVAIREETDRAIAAARQEAEGRRGEAMTALDEVGVELAAAQAERDAARVEIEGFVELKNRIGFELFEHYGGRPIIVVPEGYEIQPWGAPGFSELARYRGRSFRVVERR